MSKVAELKRLEAAHTATLQRIETLRKELAGVGKIVDHVRQEADKSGIDLLEICYALVPSLEPKVKGKKNSDGGEPARRQQRRLKRYENPNNGEIIETKGGNHRGLKEWKQQYGADVVESWATVVD
ncbi:transcriptional regulator (plasmid) [Pseudomonas sp. Leaf58]|uniref:histone-like nucleoid-structuring protein, MvaT/MvaU family n=1 Tax=unclassified Pseudomonas TaxID=196821 RepID=UPI0007018C67|nr:histone-like nucleoid-structuring protein, MvaT/MvaU family [Pseudomonas sp. Leaf58]AYG48470.1 transcriptional regulator [Pseudomonas sp. Leaf58]KQN61985.1 hypothetical protein ASF02_07290 [Pseudomonas sp. Leaf58]